MVALDQVAFRVEVDYREVTKEIMQRCLKKLDMTHPEFAGALWEELQGSGRQKTHAVQVSKWVAGMQVPKSDVLLAALKLAGLSPEEILGRLDSLNSMRVRYQSLEERIGEQERLIQELLTERNKNKD